MYVIADASTGDVRYHPSKEPGLKPEYHALWLETRKVVRALARTLGRWILNKPENLAELRNSLYVHWNEYLITIYMPKERISAIPTYRCYYCTGFHQPTESVNR